MNAPRGEIIAKCKMQNSNTTACLAEGGGCRRRRRTTIRAMKSLTFYALVITAIGTGCSREVAPATAAPTLFPAGELVDLSHAYGQDTIFWPTADKFSLRKDADGVTPAGYYYASNSFSTSEH